MQFEVVVPISDERIIATGRRIRHVAALIRLQDGTMRRAELHWYEAPGIGRQSMKIKRRYALCIPAGEYENVDLVQRKVYEVWPDPDAERHGLIRVIDESGED